MVQVCKYSIQKSADILTTVVHLQLGQTDNKSKPGRCMYRYLNIIRYDFIKSDRSVYLQ